MTATVVLLSGCAESGQGGKTGERLGDTGAAGMNLAGMGGAATGAMGGAATGGTGARPVLKLSRAMGIAAITSVSPPWNIFWASIGRPSEISSNFTLASRSPVR